jgi:hypothetical protein
MTNTTPLTHVIPVGTSEPQDFALRNAGEAINATGYTVALEISQLVNGVAVDVSSPPSAAWLSAATGSVRVTGVETLGIGNYLVRYKVTDTLGKIAFFPNGDKADQWRVVAIPAR